MLCVARTPKSYTPRFLACCKRDRAARGSVAASCATACVEHMKRKTQFDSWQALMHCRTITPPRERVAARPDDSSLWRRSWWLLGLLALVGAAAVETGRVGFKPREPARDQPSVADPAMPAKPTATARTW